jgi:hypothetical protein
MSYAHEPDPRLVKIEQAKRELSAEIEKERSEIEKRKSETDERLEAHRVLQRRQETGDISQSELEKESARLVEAARASLRRLPEEQARAERGAARADAADALLREIQQDKALEDAEQARIVAGPMTRNIDIGGCRVRCRGRQRERRGSRRHGPISRPPARGRRRSRAAVGNDDVG